MFCEKGVLRNFTKFTGKHLCQSPFFNKVAGPRQHENSFLSKFYLCTQHETFRSHPVDFCKKCVHKNFAKFTGKHLCHSVEPATLFKKRLWHKCHPVNFTKFLRTSILKNICKQLLLHFS